MSITRRAELDTDYTDGSSNNGSGSEKPNPGGDGGKDDEEARTRLYKSFVLSF